jgi:hypothetical protein
MSCTVVMGDQKSNWTNSDGYTSHNTCPLLYHNIFAEVRGGLWGPSAPPKMTDIAEKGYIAKPTMCMVCRVPWSWGAKNQIGRTPTVTLATTRAPYCSTTFSQKCEGVCGVQVPHPR